MTKLTHDQKVDLIIKDLGDEAWFMVGLYRNNYSPNIGYTHLCLMHEGDTHFHKIGLDQTAACGMDIKLGNLKFVDNDQPQWLWTDIPMAIEDGAMHQFNFCPDCIAYMDANKHLFPIDVVAAQMEQRCGVKGGKGAINK